MLEFGDKVIGTVNNPLIKNVTERDVDTIICNSFEGVTGDWATLKRDEHWNNKPKSIPSSEWATKLILEGKEVTLYDNEDPEETGTLTLEKLIKGIQLNIDKRPWDADWEEGDAETADCIVQYAMFGDLVYG